MELIVICLLMLKKNYKFKAGDSQIVANPLCLGNISEDFSGANLFLILVLIIDRATAVDDVLDIHKYLMNKNGIAENIWIY